MRKFVIGMVAVATTMIAQLSAAADTDGKTLYENFRCSGCHGESGKGSTADPRAKQITGLDSQSILQRVSRLIEKGGHEDHIGAGCAESPTMHEVQTIAEYVSRL
jgi:mono/diheme cytochrome c family protein